MMRSLCFAPFTSSTSSPPLYTSSSLSSSLSSSSTPSSSSSSSPPYFTHSNRIRFGISILQHSPSSHHRTQQQQRSTQRILKDDANTQMYRVYIPAAAAQPYLTHSTTVAEDFRKWGYRVELDSGGAGADSDGRALADEQERRSALLDLWSGEWIRRYCFARRPVRTSGAASASASDVDGARRGFAAAGGIVGTDNFGEAARGVVHVRRTPRPARWSWRTGLGSLGVGARMGRDGAGLDMVDVDVEAELDGSGVDEVDDLPRYSRGEGPPAYREY